MLRCATMLEQIDGGEICYMGERAAWVDENGKRHYPRGEEARRVGFILAWYFRITTCFPTIPC